MSKRFRAVVVLGNRLLKHAIHTELKGRMDVAVETYNVTDSNIMLLSGGRTNAFIDVTEASVMAEYAISRGMDQSHIVLEEHSLDTIGNAYFTRNAMDAIGITSSLYVVSSCYHMSRVRYVFEMCFGNNRKMDFNHCFKCDFSQESENRSMEMAKKFFDGVTPGDIEEIKGRIYSKHNLYSMSSVTSSPETGAVNKGK